jgi:outer membrane protein assembly factor BamB
VDVTNRPGTGNWYFLGRGCVRTPDSGLVGGVNAPENKGSGPGPRWWPLGLLLVVTVARLVQIWFFKDYERQFQFAATAQWLRLALPAALLWFLLLSRFRLRTRLAGLLTLAALALAAAAGFRFRGIDGDRLPVIEWRWARTTPPPAPTPGLASNPPANVNLPLPGAGDYPQFQGPLRDASLPELVLSTNWSASPPTELWRQPVGEGWSGFAVSGQRAVSLEQVGDQEVVFALDLATGKRLWASPYPARYSSSDAGNGPRSVPTIVDGRVFTAGATGLIQSWDLATGRAGWRVDLVKDLGARLPEWGYSASPLVHRGLVWVPAGAPGRSLVALDAATGQFRFGGGDSPAAYSSPLAVKLGGHDQILCLNDAGLAGHDAANGKLLWEQPIPPAPHVAAPVVLGPDRVLVSVGYGKGTFLIGVGPDATGRWTNGVVWKSIRLKSKFANLIPRGDTLYGLDDGALVALDLATGALRWKERRYGHGQLIRVGERLLVGAESGEVALVDARPEGMDELARFRALTDKTWNPPALAGNLLLLRNDREAVCYRLPLP